jgi:hypothetical protein
MRRVVFLFVTAAFVMFCGCSSDPDAATLIRDANRDNLQRLGNLYGSYQSRHGWAGPKDKETFVAYIESLNASKLERMGIEPSDIEGLFVSANDGSPFKIRFGVQGGMGATAPVIFETTGIEGEFRVGFTASKPQSVDSSRYDALWSGQNDNAAMSRGNDGGGSN